MDVEGVVQALKNAFASEFLMHEEMHGLIGRYLLLDGYHRAVELEQSDRPQNMLPNFSTGCRLLTFIKGIYTEDYARVSREYSGQCTGRSF